MNLPNTHLDQSPYFSRPLKRRKPLRHQSSPFFRQSPSSALGAVQSLEPLLFCLSLGSQAQRLTCCRRAKESLQADCSECQKVIQSAKSHFDNCIQFTDSWKACERDGHAISVANKTSCCWKRAEMFLQHSVRHLCSKRCFMRAYAPQRAWYALRQEFQKQGTDESVRKALDGWRCRLMPSSKLPRVVFISPEGNTFQSQSAVLARIFLDFSLERELSIARAYNQRADEVNSLQKCRRSLFLDQKPQKVGRIRRYDSVETPYGLLEELFTDDPWKLLISTIFLNRTTRTQVDSVLCEFLQRYPCPETVVAAKLEDVIALLRPTGMSKRRAAGIQRFSREYLNLLKSKSSVYSTSEKGTGATLTDEEVTGLFYCGKYACAAYKIFIRGDFSSGEDPCDHALKAYVAYQRGIRETC